MTNLIRAGICLIFGLIISCSSRDEEQENILVVPRTITSKSSSGESSSAYHYIDGNKLARVVSNNRTKVESFYTNKFITKTISYNELGEISATNKYEYANNKLSKVNTNIGILNYNIYYTWIDSNHVSIEDDKTRSVGSIDKTEVYLSNGNVVKTTRHLHIPNYYTIDEVNIVENDIKSNPFKNVEEFSLIAFDIKSDLFYQSNNITKITTTRTGTIDGEPMAETYIKVFNHSFNNQMFPLNYTVNDSFGNSYTYEFTY